MSDETDSSAAMASVCKKRKFFVIQPGFREEGDSPGPGIEIANKKQLRLPGTFMIEPPDGNPDQYPAKPHLVQLPELGGMPWDFEKLSGQWLVSEALKQVFESVDPQGFAFSACDFTLVDGSAGPQYYLCAVKRSLDALDEEASRVKIEYERDHQTGKDLKFYSVSGGASLIFKAEVVGDAHIFRQPRLGVDAICDRVLAEALKEAKLNGVCLRDAAEY